MHEDSTTDTEVPPANVGESEHVYEMIFREMEDAVFLIDVEQTEDHYTFTFGQNNASHRQRTGVSEGELRGQTPRELLGEEQGADVAANYRRCAEEKEPIEYEETLTVPSGTSHWHIKLAPVVDTGQVTQIVGVGRDITDRKETIFGKGEKGLDSPGTGLGLYLVRTLVEQYGGDILVEDIDPEGSVFFVELPLAEEATTE